MNVLAGIHALALTLALATSAACGDASTTDAAAPSHDSASTSSLQSKASAAFDATKASLERLKEDYSRTLEAKLAEAEPEIQELKARAAKATGDAKAELDHVIHKLDTKRKMISERLATWKQEGTQTWQSFTADLDRMAKEIQTTAKDALANDEEEGDEDK